MDEALGNVRRPVESAVTHELMRCDHSTTHPDHVWFPIGCFPHKPHVCGDPAKLGLPAPVMPKTRINAQAKGKRFELRLVKYLRENGFPEARRTVRTGYRTKTEVAQDEGDIDNTGILCFQMKALKSELSPGVELNRIYAETVAQSGERMALLVNHRNGFGDPMHWWLWLDMGDFLALFGADRDRTGAGFRLVRVSLGDVIKELHWYGIGGMG